MKEKWPKSEISPLFSQESGSSGRFNSIFPKKMLRLYVKLPLLFKETVEFLLEYAYQATVTAVNSTPAYDAAPYWAPKVW